MKKKLFISTAGIGSRVSGLGMVPNKSMLPINYEARHIDKVNKNTLLIIGNNNKAYRLDLIEK